MYLVYNTKKGEVKVKVGQYGDEVDDEGNAVWKERKVGTISNFSGLSIGEKISLIYIRELEHQAHRKAGCRWKTCMQLAFPNTPDGKKERWNMPRNEIMDEWTNSILSKRFYGWNYNW